MKGEYFMKIDERIVGNMELYMAFHEEDNFDDKLYVAVKTDFHKPLTESSLLMLLESYGNFVCKFGNFDKDKLVCEYISKEEYDKNTADDDEFDTVKLSFSDDSLNHSADCVDSED